jgi:hypothetical protein
MMVMTTGVKPPITAIVPNPAPDSAAIGGFALIVLVLVRSSPSNGASNRWHKAAAMMPEMTS